VAWASPAAKATSRSTLNTRYRVNGWVGCPSPVAETTGAESRGDWGRFGLRRSYVYGWKVLAGVVGFEPTIFSTKNCCLTTWPHPISEPRSSVSFGGAQEGFWKNPKLFPPVLSRPADLVLLRQVFIHLDQHRALPRPCLDGLMGVASL
jgi:hypothetical protein